MSDIVDRLMVCAKFDPDQKEAAEEIKRLRAERAAERERAERLEGVLIEARLYLSGDAPRAANLANLLARIDALVIKGGGDEG